MKKILILDGHPDSQSFCRAIADQYESGARAAGRTVTRLNIRDLQFDPINHFGYRQIQPLEPDLLRAQEAIRQCEHLVLVSPVWWGSPPALLKGFFDRALTSGFSHRFNPEKKIPEKLLGGRSATVLYTQGAKWWYSKFVIGDPFWKVIRNSVLGFCGFSPINRYCFDTVKSGDDNERKRILTVASGLGNTGA